MNTMRQQQELLQSYLKQAKVSLSKKPQGILSTSYSHHCIQFCWKSSPSDHKWVYLPKKETKLIQALAQKDYDTRFIKTAEKLAKTTDWIILNPSRKPSNITKKPVKTMFHQDVIT